MAITVIDALMGVGKTQYVFKRMRENPGRKWMYIGVNLEEADRATKECPELRFKNPVPRQGRKYWDLVDQVEKGSNIASTHQLFRLMTGDLKKALEGKGYTLVIDEALDVVSQYNIDRRDLAWLQEVEAVYVDDDQRLRWNHDKVPEYEGKFRELVGLCDNGNLVQTRQGVLMWQFPAEFLSVFDQVFICTYMFEGQVMADYFKAEGVKYGLFTVKDGELLPHAAVDNTEDKERLADLIRADLNPNRNIIGKKIGKTRPLSKNWFEARNKAKDGSALRADLAQLRRNTEGFFKQFGGGANENMWTCFKEYRNKVKGARYSHYKRCFVPMNMKATDQWKHKTALAYLVNRYQSPVVESYFQDRNVLTRSDLFALTELIQWIWRSAIRGNPPQEIQLYLPSDRMKTILANWIRYSDAEIVAGQRLDGERLKEAA